MTNPNFFRDYIDLTNKIENQETILNRLKNELEQQIKSLEQATIEHQQIQTEKQIRLESCKAQLLQAKDPQEIYILEVNIEKIQSFLEKKNFEHLQKDAYNVIIQLKQQLKKLS